MLMTCDPQQRSTSPEDVAVIPDETSGPLAEAFLEQRNDAGVFVGLSVRNRMVNRRSLELLLPWVFRHASTGGGLPSRIVVGDHLARHNFAALEGHSVAAAADKAARLGDRPRRHAAEVIREHGLEGSVILQSCSELIETDRCRVIKEQVRQFAARNPGFDADLSAEVQRFIRRRGLATAATESKINDGRVADALAAYVIEEVAMFLLLYEMGYFVEVYPGADLGIMRRIASGSYTDFPVRCPLRTHISVAIPAAPGKPATGDAR